MASNSINNIDGSSTSFYSCDNSSDIINVFPGKTPANSLITSSSSSHVTVREKSASPVRVLSHDQQLLLQSSAAKLKNLLQLSYLHGGRVGLTHQQVDKYVIDHVFDNLSDTLLKSIDNRTRGSCTHYTIDCDVYVHPPLHDTEKSLLASFSHCWRLTTNSKEAADKPTVLLWFNQGLMAAGLPAWQLTSKRWRYVCNLLGLNNGKMWALRSNSCSPIVHLNDQMRLV